MNAAVGQVGVRAAFKQGAVESKDEQDDEVGADLDVGSKLAHRRVVARTWLNAEQGVAVPLPEIVEATKIVALREAERADGSSCASQTAHERCNGTQALNVQRPYDKVVHADVLTHQHAAALPRPSFVKRHLQLALDFKRHRDSQHWRPR